MSWYAYQDTARSLIRNGNFSQGASFWEGSNIAHQLYGSGYGMLMTRTLAALPPGVPAGMWQYLPRARAVAFGSTRRVSNISIVPLAPNRVLLRTTKGTTLVDGQILGDVVSAPLSIPIGDYTADLLFQHPFMTRDIQSGSITSHPVPVGSPVPVTDYQTPQLSHAFLATRVVFTSNQLPGDVAGVDLSKYYALGLEVSSQDSVYSAVLDQGSPVQASVVAGSLVVNTTQDLSNHVLVAGPAVALITGGSGTYALIPLSAGDPFVDGPSYPFPGDGDLAEWSIYKLSEGGCSRTMDLFRYSLTVAYSYDTALTVPALPELEFTDAPGEIVGAGSVVNRIPRRSASVRIVDDLLAQSARTIVAFDLETASPRPGRPRLRIALPGSTPFQEISVGFQPSAQYPLGSPEYPAYDVQFFVPQSSTFDLASLATAPYPTFTLTDVTNGQLPLATLPQFSAYPLTQLQAAQVGSDEVYKGVTGKFVVMQVPGDVVLGGPTLVILDSLRLLFSQALIEAALVADVTLVDGDMTTVFDVTDGYANPDPLPLDSLVAFDPLSAKLDPEEGAIPKGTIILHAGPGCPPGFRRVNAHSGTDRLAYIAAPDTSTYVSAQDETVLQWDALSLPVVGPDGAIQPIDALTHTLEIPGSPTIIVDIQVAQQQIQPGMTLRVPSSVFPPELRGPAERYDPAFLVLDVRPTASDTTALAGNPSATISGGYSEGQIAYPATLASTLIEAPFQSDTPYAPPLPEQTNQWAPNLEPLLAKGDTSVLVVESGQLVGLRFTGISVNGGSYFTLLNGAHPGLPVGTVLWVSWLTSMPYSTAQALDTGVTASINNLGEFFRTGFVGVITEFTTTLQGEQTRVVRRYDGKPIYTPAGTATLSQLSGPAGLPLSLTASTLTLSPVKLYGATQTYTGSAPTVTGLEAVQTVGASASYWVVGPPSSLNGGGLTIRVKGRYPDATAGAIIEPGGFLQYGPYGMVYGAGGHSHMVTPDSPSETLATWPLADQVLHELPSAHTHGLLAQYEYNYPAHVMLSPCEKL